MEGEHGNVGVMPSSSYNTLQPDPAMPSQPSGMLQRFIKVQPKALGVAQIMIGLAHIGLGGLLVSIPWKTALLSGYAIGGLPFWGSLFFIISGALSTAAEVKGTARLVQASMGSNISSAILACINVIIASRDMAFAVFIVSQSGLCSSINNEGCILYRDSMLALRQGILGLIVIFMVLEACVALLTSIFACKAVCPCCSSSA